MRSTLLQADSGVTQAASRRDRPNADASHAADVGGEAAASGGEPPRACRVAILFNDASQQSSAADQDVMEQVSAVAEALERLGAEPRPVPCTLDLADAQRRLEQLQPDVVFNLVESLGGSDRLMVLATLLLDAMGLPYTGCATDAIYSTTNKLRAKQRLRDAGLPTAAWVGTTANQTALAADPQRVPVPFPCQVVLKTVWEHASYALDDDAVVSVDSGDHLRALLASREAKLGRPCFAEQFIDGREFNLSLLAAAPRDLARRYDLRPMAGDLQTETKAQGSQPSTSTSPLLVLPPAEIDFSTFPLGKPRIVGCHAKWDSASFEFQQTPRLFDFAPADQPLLAELSNLAVHCWKLFGLGGYARVDFRVDAAGRPWILEINANPCLSLDAGFAAAVARGGLTYDCAIGRIAGAAMFPWQVPA